MKVFSISSRETEYPFKNLRKVYLSFDGYEGQLKWFKCQTQNYDREVRQDNVPGKEISAMISVTWICCFVLVNFPLWLGIE